MSVGEILKLIAVAVVAAAIWFGLSTVMEWREGSLANEQHKQDAHAAEGIMSDADNSRQEKARVEFVVTDGRDTYQRTVREAEANEPETRSYGDMPIPRSVRDAARARRLARERSQRAGIEREERQRTEASAER